MATPTWAQDLAIRVALDEGRDELPTLQWRRSKYGPFSTGTTYTEAQRIVVTAGKDRKDQKLVLLHELAHWLTPGQNHGPAFWDQAWRLYRRYGVPLRYAKLRERFYRKGSVAAYARTKGGKD